MSDGPCTVMVVDDVASERRLLRMVLESSGRFAVTAEAGDGQEAVERAAAVAPDLILLDLSMPRMDGLEALPLLRTAVPSARIVVLSGFSARHQASAVLEQGAHSYLEKGLHPDELLAHLASVAGIPAPAGGAATVGRAALDGPVRVAAGADIAAEPAVLWSEVLAAFHEGVVVQDVNGAITFCNPAAKRLLGLVDDRSTGRTVPDPAWRAIDEGGRALPGDRHPSMVAVATGAAQTEVPLVIERPDGQRHWLLVTATPLLGRDGQPYGVVSSFLDVSARRHAEERFAALVDAAQDAIIALTPDGAISAWNPAAEHMYGWSADEIAGQRLSIVLPPERGHDVPALLARIRAGERSAPFDAEHIRKDGSRLLVSVTLSPLRDATGQVVGGSVMARDVTELRESEHALRRSEQRQRITQQMAPIGLAVVGLDGSWREVNPALCRMFGRTEEELLALTLHDLTHPDDVDPALAQRLLGGDIASYTAERRYLHADGRSRWGELHVSLVRTDAGEPHHFIVQLVDITERKRSTELLDFLFEGSPDLLCIVDRHGRFLKVNPSWTTCLGWTEDELLSTPFIQFVEPAERAATARLLAALTDTQGAGGQFECRLRSKDGRQRWLQWHTSVLADPRFVVANARDITEEKRQAVQLEAQRSELARSNAELEQFAYIASHDLSEPLRVMSGFADLLRKEYGPVLTADGRQYVDHITAAAERMNTLIADLLAYSRIGSDTAERRRVELSAVLAEVTATLQPIIDEADAVIQAAALPVILGYPNDWRQLLQNLLSNALKFRVDGRAPQVRVDSGMQPDGGVRLTVDDNGIGIPPGQREQVFGMFQRLHARTRYPGTGIGLAICRKIVERHGGAIALDDSPLGGTRVVVDLPPFVATAAFADPD